jgi:hypothetical protein
MQRCDRNWTNNQGNLAGGQEGRPSGVKNSGAKHNTGNNGAKRGVGNAKSCYMRPPVMRKGVDPLLGPSWARFARQSGSRSPQGSPWC